MQHKSPNPFLKKNTASSQDFTVKPKNNGNFMKEKLLITDIKGIVKEISFAISFHVVK